MKFMAFIKISINKKVIIKRNCPKTLTLIISSSVTEVVSSTAADIWKASSTTFA